MSTVTIRVDEGLKARVASAAQRAGKTTHAFIVDAITRAVELDEAFDRVPDARWTTLLATERSIPWPDAKAWLDARSRGELPRRLAARRLARRSLPATRIELASELLGDFDRILRNLAELDSSA